VRWHGRLETEAATLNACGSATCARSARESLGRELDAVEILRSLVKTRSPDAATAHSVALRVSAREALSFGESDEQVPRQFGDDPPASSISSTRKT
jgi:hypothetical protein